MGRVRYNFKRFKQWLKMDFKGFSAGNGASDVWALIMDDPNFPGGSVDPHDLLSYMDEKYAIGENRRYDIAFKDMVFGYMRYKNEMKARPKASPSLPLE